MIRRRAPRTPETSSSLVPTVTSLILSPPKGVTDPWAAAYDWLVPVFQPQNVPPAYFIILYVASAAWVVLWLLALAALIVRTRKVGFGLFTWQSGILVPRTTTLFLLCLLAFLGVAQGYIWRTIMILWSWRNYPFLVSLQASTWTLLGVTAYSQAWGMVCAANFTGPPTRLHRDRPRLTRTFSRPSASTSSSTIGRPFIPPLAFNLVFALLLPGSFLGVVIASGIFSARSCSGAFVQFRDTMDLLLEASSNAGAINATGQTDVVLAQVTEHLRSVETEGRICQAWGRVYYALFGIVPTLLLVAEVVGFLALYRQLNSQLSLLDRAVTSVRRWQTHEASFQHSTSQPPPIVPLVLPSTSSLPRPVIGDGSVPHSPTHKRSFSQAANVSAPQRLQRFPSSESTSPSHTIHGDRRRPSLVDEAMELPERQFSKTEESFVTTRVDRHRTYPTGAWIEAKMREVKRARRNLILQTAAWSTGAINYGAMAWIVFYGTRLSGVVTVWSFVAMPVIALPILLTLLVNGLSGDIDQGFIGLVHVPEAQLPVARDDREEDEEDDYFVGISPVVATAEKRLPPAPPLPTPSPPHPPPPAFFTTIGGGTSASSVTTDEQQQHPQQRSARFQPSSWQQQRRISSRRLPSWTFHGEQDDDDRGIDPASGALT